ncbi:MAG: hypothetical protein RLZZ500_2263 [Bacteroidota bacterium]|jgi:glycosyltransferase involved in cell wall biosynthesis
MKKIFVLIPSPLSFKSFLLETYLKLGYETHVICKQYDDKSIYEEKFIYHFIEFERNLTIRSTARAIGQLRLLVKNLKPNLIHAHFSSAALLLALTKTKEFPPCLATIQGSIYLATPNYFTKFFYKIAEIYSAKKLDYFYVLTDDDYTSIKGYSKNVFLQKAKGFGVNLAKFDTSKMHTIQNSNFILDANKNTLIYVGRLVSFKGFNFVLRVFDGLDKRYPEKFQLILCGTFDKIHGSDLNSDEKNIFENNKNIIKCGFVSDVRPYLLKADLNIFPSTREGMPVNLMESIAMGVPVITSNHRGCRHVVTPFINGVIVENFNLEIWIKKINEYFENENYKNQLAVGCLKTRFLFDEDLYVKELTELYSEVLLTQ